MENTVVNYKVLELEVRQITIKREDGTKNEFNAYKSYLKSGKKIDVKFTRDVKNLPTTDCRIKVAIGDMNVDSNRKFPVLWIRKITEILDVQKFNRKPEDYKELDEMFSNDLPF